MPELVLVGAVESTRVALESASGAEGWTVRAVVTLPPDMARRHSDYCDLAPPAQRIGAEVIYATQINSPDVIARIGAAAPDLILVVGWSQICGPDLLALCPGRVLGYHPAPLPRLRGRAAIPWTILLQEPISAGTLFWIDEGTDSGPIVQQRFFLVPPDETALSLYSRHMAVLAPLISDALQLIRSGQGQGVPQDERLATFAARRKEADGLIDWTQNAKVIDRLVRAVGPPYPGAFTFRGEDKITIWASEAEPEGGYQAAMPGQIVSVSSSDWLVKTGDGILRVLSSQQPVEVNLQPHQRLG